MARCKCGAAYSILGVCDSWNVGICRQLWGQNVLQNLGGFIIMPRGEIWDTRWTEILTFIFKDTNIVFLELLIIIDYKCSSGFKIKQNSKQVSGRKQGNECYVCMPENDEAFIKYSLLNTTVQVCILNIVSSWSQSDFWTQKTFKVT